MIRSNRHKMVTFSPLLSIFPTFSLALGAKLSMRCVNYVKYFQSGARGKSMMIYYELGNKNWYPERSQNTQHPWYNIIKPWRIIQSWRSSLQLIREPCFLCTASEPWSSNHLWNPIHWPAHSQISHPNLVLARPLGHPLGILQPGMAHTSGKETNRPLVIIWQMQPLINLNCVEK